MNKPLWQPSEKLKENSLLKGFCKFINFKSSNKFKKIWQWSIDDPNDFWSKFWDYSKIIGDKGSEIIKKDNVFNKTKFFPDSKLNYTENILKKKSNKLAINFAAIGTLGLPFLSCLAKPKYGMTATILFAEALLAASTINKSSIRLSDGGGVDCTIKTSQPLTVSSKDGSSSPSLKVTIETLPMSAPNLLAI